MVTIGDAMLSQYGGNQVNISGYEARLTLLPADIHDKAAVDDSIRGQHLLFNSAAQMSHNDDIEDLWSNAQIDFLGHLNVLENARLNNPDVRIIHSGSRLQYGKVTTLPMHESTRSTRKHPMRSTRQSAKECIDTLTACTVSTA